ncbi:hypothetical protein BGX38DRAFT_208998 [Terfezia claveryi]|nr:hypothetical protein BGX38DRAFT_208998 [Terfezia claveryi]
MIRRRRPSRRSRAKLLLKYLRSAASPVASEVTLERLEMLDRYYSMQGGPRVSTGSSNWDMQARRAMPAGMGEFMCMGVREGGGARSLTFEGGIQWYRGSVLSTYLGSAQYLSSRRLLFVSDHRCAEAGAWHSNGGETTRALCSAYVANGKYRDGKS